VTCPPPSRGRGHLWPPNRGFAEVFTILLRSEEKIVATHGVKAFLQLLKKLVRAFDRTDIF
jgi:hypothetical protein